MCVKYTTANKLTRNNRNRMSHTDKWTVELNPDLILSLVNVDIVWFNVYLFVW